MGLLSCWCSHQRRAREFGSLTEELGTPRPDHGWLLEGAGGPQLQARWVLGPHVGLGPVPLRAAVHLLVCT